MLYLFWGLNYLYGSSMLLAIFSFRQLSPNWLIWLNVSASCLLFATPKSKLFFYSGLVLLLIAAYLNGSLILRENNLSHFILRLGFSLLLVLLYQTVVKPN